MSPIWCMEDKSFRFATFRVLECRLSDTQKLRGCNDEIAFHDQ